MVLGSRWHPINFDNERPGLRVHGVACADPEVGAAGPDPHPLKNHNNIGVVFAILVRIP